MIIKNETAERQLGRHSRKEPVANNTGHPRWRMALATVPITQIHSRCRVSSSAERPGKPEVPKQVET